MHRRVREGYTAEFMIDLRPERGRAIPSLFPRPRSFRRLMRRRRRTVYTIRPVSVVWPMVGQPLHFAGEKPNTDIALAAGDFIKARAAAEKPFRKMHATDTRRFTKAVAGVDEIVDRKHGSGPCVQQYALSSVKVTLS